MASSNVDVVIVGAGCAGLTALRELQGAGLNVLCVEARDRTGGRILTVRDPLAALPIELGAEFIHGRSPAIWDITHSAGLAVYDCGEHAARIKNGKPEKHGDPWSLAGQVMNDMQRVASRGKDRSFASFLKQSSRPEDAKQIAASYVEGFNAARQEIIGIASLAEDARAADEIDGDHSFRFRDGYDSVIGTLVQDIEDLPSKLKLNSIVERIEWRAGSAILHVRSAISGDVETLRCGKVIITVPLGVLQAQPDAAGAIRFDPEPDNVLAAARKLCFGQVIRLILRFREPFWEKRDDLSDAGFFFSDERFFPTWWTPLPFRAPVLTGWSAGPHADDLLGQPQSKIVKQALHDLGRITRFSSERLSKFLVSAYFHDWHGDPFSRGAYSYVPAGALAARELLAKPIRGTLFFAGEATELNGHSATVHGAIATGKRAAKQMLEHSR